MVVAVIITITTTIGKIETIVARAILVKTCVITTRIIITIHLSTAMHIMVEHTIVTAAVVGDIVTTTITIMLITTVVATKVVEIAEIVVATTMDMATLAEISELLVTDTTKITISKTRQGTSISRTTMTLTSILVAAAIMVEVGATFTKTVKVMAVGIRHKRRVEAAWAVVDESRGVAAVRHKIHP